MTTPASSTSKQPTTTSSSPPPPKSITPSKKQKSSSSSTSSSSSIWSIKLTKKLTSLTTNASRESLQTISKWMIFHRKHYKTFTSCLLSLILNNNDNNNTSTTTSLKRKVLYLNIAHELCIANSSVAAAEDVVTSDVRWEKMNEFRVYIGEVFVVDVLEHLGECFAKEEENEDEELMTKVKSMMDVWEKVNAFGGISIVEGGRRALERGLKDQRQQQQQQHDEENDNDVDMGEATKEEEDLAKKTEEKKEEIKPSPKTLESKDMEIDDDQKEEETAAPLPTASSNDEKMDKEESTTSVEVETAKEATTPPVKEEQPATVATKKEEQPQQQQQQQQVVEEEEKEFDFESEGIPYAPVQAKEFLPPCKAIASIQITRDFLNDATLQLSQLLSSIPPSIEQACRDALSNKKDKIDDDLKESLPELSDEILDLNLSEALQNVKQYHEVIQKQKYERQKVFRLLCQSRCNFGSMESAKKYYELKDILEQQLRKRKIMVEDAMELEGLDMENIAQEEDDEESGNEGEKKGKKKGKEEQKGFAWFDPDVEQENEDGSSSDRSAKRIKVGA